MRTFVIGDIHGGLRALEELMATVKPKYGDKFIFLGDYVDGWSESAGVISFLMDFSENHACVFVRGNHDAWCESWLRTGKPDEHWLFHGGKSTVKSYEAYQPFAKESHLVFFERMVDYFVDDEKHLFVHAGFTSWHGPEKETYSSNFYWDRTLWEAALSMDKGLTPVDIYYPRRLKHFKEIFIGHTPTSYWDCYEPMHAANVWNVDTGAAFKGPLTMLELDGKAIFQSTPVWKLYPEEKGRN